MFHLNVLQNKYVMLALIGGLMAVLMIVISYLAIWRPRRNDAMASEDNPDTVWVALRSVPWIIVVSYAGILIWGIIYTIAKAINPPNW